MRKRQSRVLGNVNYVHRHVKNSAVEPDDRLVMARDQMSPLGDEVKEIPWHRYQKARRSEI